MQDAVTAGAELPGHLKFTGSDRFIRELRRRVRIHRDARPLRLRWARARHDRGDRGDRGEHDDARGCSRPHDDHFITLSQKKAGLGLSP